MASKPAKPAPAAPAEDAPAPAKSHKLLIIIIGLLVVIIAGGAGWYFTKGSAPAEEHAAEHKPAPVHEPIFIPLDEKFTVNLQREEGDQYLQAGITLKILDPELDPKIKSAMPEIRSKLLFLLSSKKPSELGSSEGKLILVDQIIAEVDRILGIEPEKTAAPAAVHTAPAAHGETGHGEAASGVVAAQAAPAPRKPKTTGVVDVLFSDFIIQ